MVPEFIGGNEAVHLVVRIHEQLMANLRVDYDNAGLGDLSPSHGGLLAALASRQGLTMSELVSVTNRDKSTVTALCQKLERIGLIARATDADDLRCARATLTNKGKKAAAKIRRAAQRQIIILQRALDEPDRRHLTLLMRKWLNGLQGSCA